ncbi:hypothetical protein ACOMHN_030450 [Nucella lapillus]
MLFSLLLRYAFSQSKEGVYLHTRSDSSLFNLARLCAKTKGLLFCTPGCFSKRRSIADQQRVQDRRTPSEQRAPGWCMPGALNSVAPVNSVPRVGACPVP